MDEQQYLYTGLPLTPAVAAELVLELFSGHTERRQIIVETVRSAHLARGGADASAVDLPRTVKKGLESLKKKGFCSNPSTGFWRVNASEPIRGEQPSIATLVPAQGRASLPEPDSVIGSGDGSVYVYYLPIYKHVSAKEGRTTWPYKIGRSDRDPILRVMSQSGTALPEKPKVALLIKTDQPAVLEAALHSVLRLRGKWRQEALGSEWFDTSPEEIRQLVALFCEGRD